MFVAKKSLANVRPQTNDEGTLSTTPTKGNLKISAKGADICNLSDGDYIDVVQGENDENGNPTFAVTKGSKTESGQHGQKLAASLDREEGVALGFSSANIWATLGGSRERKVAFKINPTPVVADNGDGTTTSYFVLSYHSISEVNPRKKASDKVEAMQEANA